MWGDQKSLIRQALDQTAARASPTDRNSIRRHTPERRIGFASRIGTALCCREPGTCHMARENLPTGPPSAWAILSGPLPELKLVDRMLVRSIALVSRRKVCSLDGLDYIAPELDPFILAANHSTRQEAIVLPALLFVLRHGRRIHFMADWTFRMIPGVDLLYRLHRRDTADPSHPPPPPALPPPH